MANNLLLKQFIEGKFKSRMTQYTKIFGNKSPKTLDRIIPNLSGNLLKSTQSFIEAVLTQNVEFVEETATLALKKRLIPALEDLKKNHIEIKQLPLINTTKIKPQILNISPYVIFGQKMEDRLKLLSPWASISPFLGLNRYMYYDQLQGASWEKIKNNHIYGFHCHYQNIEKQFQIINGSMVLPYPPQQFIVTFETDAENHEFYAADFNYFVKYVDP